MPRKWQVQLGPNFIKHNRICALILPRRLAAAVAPWEEKKENKRERERETREESSPSNSGTSGRLFLFSSSLFLLARDEIDSSDRVALKLHAARDNDCPVTGRCCRLWYGKKYAIRGIRVCECIARSIKDLNKLCATRSDLRNFSKMIWWNATVTKVTSRFWANLENAFAAFIKDKNRALGGWRSSESSCQLNTNCFSEGTGGHVASSSGTRAWSFEPLKFIDFMILSS